VKCRLLGVVLNAVDSSAPDYYYSYRYYPYSYGYGAKDSAPEAHPDAGEEPEGEAAFAAAAAHGSHHQHHHRERDDDIHQL
jgi:hypothetical protein